MEKQIVRHGYFSSAAFIDVSLHRSVYYSVNSHTSVSLSSKGVSHASICSFFSRQLHTEAVLGYTSGGSSGPPSTADELDIDTSIGSIGSADIQFIVSDILNVSGNPIPILSSSVSFIPADTLNISANVGSIGTNNIKFLHNDEIDFSVNLGCPYGRQFQDDLPLEEAGDFLTDHYSIKYLSDSAMQDRYDVVSVITAISNLLRNCYNLGIDEIFMGTIRIKKVKDRDYYILVEW